MAKNIIIAEKQVGEKTVTRTFNKITWDLLGVDKGGFVEVKQGKTPKELKGKKAEALETPEPETEQGEQLDIPTE